MYCPKCSQKQVEDGLRFCSRCGFQLGVVKELLAERRSALVMTGDSDVRTGFFSRRKQDLIFGASVLYWAAVVVVLISWVQPKAPIIFPLGMIWITFSLFVLFFDALTRLGRRFFSDHAEEETRVPYQGPPSFITKVGPSTSALPPMQDVAVATSGTQRVNTGEILQPRSVIEHTTELLNKK